MTKVTADWVGGSATVGGKKVTGWVQKSRVTGRNSKAATAERRLARLAGPQPRRQVARHRPAERVAGRTGRSCSGRSTGIGVGFSSVAVVGGKVYITGDEDGKLMIFAFDLDGKPLWKTEHRPGRGGPDGSRASPVIDGGNLYLLNGNGLIGCFDAAGGEKKWTREAKEFGGSPGGWGYAESVLIYKNLAIFKPGGKNCIVALDKTTGETSLEEQRLRGRPGVRLLHRRHLPRPADDRHRHQPAASSPSTPTTASCSGRNDCSAGNTANCPTPAYADGYVFWANGYGKGGICLKLAKRTARSSADAAWTTHDMVCHHGGYVIDKGYIYGNHGGGWACLDLKTGKKKWQREGVGKGSLCFADGMLYLFGENGGQAALATCSPEGLQIKGKVKVQGNGPSWAHPVVVGGRLYLRYDTNLYCFDVKRSG